MLAQASWSREGGVVLAPRRGLCVQCGRVFRGVGAARWQDGRGYYRLDLRPLAGVGSTGLRGPAGDKRALAANAHWQRSEP